MTMTWQEIFNEPINGRPWSYHVTQASLSVRYATPCGDLVQKIATLDQLAEILGKRLEPSDTEEVKFNCCAMIEEDGIPYTIVGDAGANREH